MHCAVCACACGSPRLTPWPGAAGFTRRFICGACVVLLTRWNGWSAMTTRDLIYRATRDGNLVVYDLVAGRREARPPHNETPSDATICYVEHTESWHWWAAGVIGDAPTLEQACAEAEACLARGGNGS
jgi:hypothetical protein